MHKQTLPKNSLKNGVLPHIGTGYTRQPREQRFQENEPMLLNLLWIYLFKIYAYKPTI